MSSDDERPVFFFDIDNCLYPRSKRVQDLMQDLIDNYFVNHLSLPAADATKLHEKYYKDYGLAISGLVKHHQIDPLAYNREVDDALPLEGVITKDEDLRHLLQDVDRQKVKLWLFTNAYVTHAKRVVRLLGVDDLFEGLTFCDYGQTPLYAKPHAQMFEKAEREAGVVSRDQKGGDEEKRRQCYFVDDSALNCRHAVQRGWTVVHKLEDGDRIPEERDKAGTYQVTKLEDLRTLFPQFFKSTSSASL